MGRIPSHQRMHIVHLPRRCLPQYLTEHHHHNLHFSVIDVLQTEVGGLAQYPHCDTLQSFNLVELWCCWAHCDAGLESLHMGRTWSDQQRSVCHIHNSWASSLVASRISDVLHHGSLLCGVEIHIPLGAMQLTRWKRLSQMDFSRLLDD
jgi:hypothetical protein